MGPIEGETRELNWIRQARPFRFPFWRSDQQIYTVRSLFAVSSKPKVPGLHNMHNPSRFPPYVHFMMLFVPLVDRTVLSCMFTRMSFRPTACCVPLSLRLYLCALDPAATHSKRRTSR